MSESDQIDACHAALGGLVSPGVGFAVDRVSKQSDSIFAEEAAHLTSAAPHRRDEFLTGRMCARIALAQVGAQPCALLADAEGVPQYPESYLASITHSRGLAAAAAGSTERLQYLGLDLEKTNRLSPAAIRRILHPDEVDWVGQNQLRASLIFSAKEAFYKAQYPRWRIAANFNDLSFELDAASCQLRVAWIADRFAPQLREGIGQMQFRYAYFGEYVVSLCWL